MGRMSKQDKLEWNELYEYVKYSILDYPKEKSLPRLLILRLRGLRNGKFIANNNTQSLGDYPFNMILLTFKINKLNIINSLSDKSKFKNEDHMINYMMTIVENKINDVFDTITNKERAEKRTDEIIINENKIKDIYITKTLENKNERLKDLW
ncbi:hypothetical protein ACV3UV_11980 [Clostridium perfringens]